jgi:hypothetical protein
MNNPLQVAVNSSLRAQRTPAIIAPCIVLISAIRGTTLGSMPERVIHTGIYI